MLLAHGPRIAPRDLTLTEPDRLAVRRVAPELPPPGWRLRDGERALVEEALAARGLRAEGRRQLLGVSRRKLNYMIRSMGITHDRWRRNRTLPSGSRRPA